MQNIKGNFLSTENLIGVDNLYKIKNSHVCIVGLGGVGSWVAEALVRQGVEKLTLIDLDHIVESNINRQIQAFETNIGESKIKALSSRIKNINSTCELVLVEDFLTNENIPSLINSSMNVVIDAIDKVDVKISLIDFCHDKDINLIVSGGAGGRIDPGKVKVADLLSTFGDPLLSKIRKNFKKKYPSKKKLKVPTVFSDEQVKKSLSSESQTACNLSCSGYGSSVMVTGVMGFNLAFAAQKFILES